MDALLKIDQLTVEVAEDRKTILKNVSLEIPLLKTVGLVGGSGSGKTTAGLSILRLLPPALTVKSGAIFLGGENILQYSEERMRELRGKDVAMIFQEPLNAFNPVFTIQYQIAEVLRFHTTLTPAKIEARVLELLDLVQIPEPRRVAGEYPHRLSGGMRQRAMIAQAIAANPRLIIADEPTSNLDVTIQSRIIELFRHLRRELKMTMLLITHDLGLVEHLADEVAVMLEGRIVESGHAVDVIRNPRHEYTQRLMGTIKV